MPNNELKGRQLQTLLTEYKTCKDKINTFTSLMWQTGAIFIAGSIALLGIMFSIWGDLLPNIRVVFVGLLFFGSLSTFLFWRFIMYSRYRWFNLLALLRCWAIEKYLIKDFDAINKLEYEGIKTEMIENWIKEKDNISEKACENFLKGVKKTLKNPPTRRIHRWIVLLVCAFAIIWVVMLILSICLWLV